jgi:hypothetical protein
MTVYILIPLLVCVIGAFTYVAAAKAELKEIGRLCFACGLLVTLFVVANHMLKF